MSVNSGKIVGKALDFYSSTIILAIPIEFKRKLLNDMYPYLLDDDWA